MNEYSQLELELLTQNKACQDILDDLPHCWRLDENGEFRGDVPIIPGMTVWHCYPTHIKLQKGAPWECKVLSICESAYVTVQVKKPEYVAGEIMEEDEVYLYATPEAARVCMKIIAKKDEERLEKRKRLKMKNK